VPLPYARKSIASSSISAFERPGSLFTAFMSYPLLSQDPRRCLFFGEDVGLHTVFVMPSVNLTNSIVSLESRHSGRSVRMRLSAELCESLLS
jgi:hypothetical protein